MMSTGGDINPTGNKIVNTSNHTCYNSAFIGQNVNDANSSITSADCVYFDVSSTVIKEEGGYLCISRIFKYGGRNRIIN
jgi:hypothetical protein